MAVIGAIAWLASRVESSEPRRRARAIEDAARRARDEARAAHVGDFDLDAKLPELREYVRVASQALSLESLRSAPVAELPPAGESSIHYARRCTTLALARFGMSVDRLTVQFTELSGDHAGRVHREGDGGWVVDITPSANGNGEMIAAIVGHEIAHVALLSRGIRLTPVLRNEELTDTAAVLAGFGPLMLRTVHREELRFADTALEVERHTLGYLKAPALAWLSTLRVEMAGGAAEFYRDHVPDWQRETVSRYIALRDAWQRDASRRHGAVVNCFGCGMSMKLPAVRSAIRVKCRTCGFAIEIPA